MEKKDNVWEEQFYKLADYYKSKYTGPLTFRNFYCFGIDRFGCLDCLEVVYGLMVTNEQVRPIESMLQERKQELWDRAKVLLGEEATKENRVRLIKGFCVFEVLIGVKQPEKSFAKQNLS